MEITSQPLRINLSMIVLLLMLAMFLLLPLRATSLTMYCIGYAHYLLAIYYSRRGIQSAWSSRRSKWLLLAMLPLAFVPFLSNSYEHVVIGLVIYFGLHHTMSEVYFDAKRHSKRFRSLHWWAVLGSYFAITGHHVPSFLYSEIIGWVVCIAATTALLVVRKREGELSLRYVLHTCPWLLLGPVVALIGEFVFLDWRFLINWHFFFWLFIPHLRKGMFTPRKTRIYWAQNAVLIGFFAFLFYALNVGPSTEIMDFSVIGTLVLSQFFLAWSYFHISWSFLVSGGNPGWLKNWVSSAK